MITQEYLVFKDSDKKEHKTQLTKITGINEVIEEVNANEQLHDWSLEYIACDGKDAQITVKSYEDETLFHFHMKGLKQYKIELDVLVRWLYEVNIKVSSETTIIFDGVGVEITAKEVTLEIQKKIS